MRKKNRWRMQFIGCLLKPQFQLWGRLYVRVLVTLESRSATHWSTWIAYRSLVRVIAVAWLAGVGSNTPVSEMSFSSSAVNTVSLYSIGWRRGHSDSLWLSAQLLHNCGTRCFDEFLNLVPLEGHSAGVCEDHHKWLVDLVDIRI